MGATSYLISRHARYQIERRAYVASQGDPSASTSCFMTVLGMERRDMEKWSIEKAVARVLQALMFVVCYALTRLIANKTYWHSDTASSAAGEWILIVFLFF